jgi:hypothetical protein
VYAVLLQTATEKSLPTNSDRRTFLQYCFCI